MSINITDEPRTDWDKVNADREGWGWSLCPCGLMFYVEHECDHGAGMLRLMDEELACGNNDCIEEADWLLICRQPSAESGKEYDFQRYHLCDIHVWPAQDIHEAFGWECITPELY